MRMFWGIVLALCFSFPSPASPFLRQEASPATTPSTQDAPDKQQSPQAEEGAASKPDAKSKANVEPESTTRIEPPDKLSSQPTGKSRNQPKTEPKKKPAAGESIAATQARPSVTRAPVPTPEDAPRKIVVREGGADEPPAQIVSGITPQQASRKRQNTEGLLNSTWQILERLSGRTLNAEQQDTLSQIHNYMEGSRSALKEGDIARGHTLALKANLLADDLEKH